MIATLYISSIPAIILSVVFIAFVYLFKKPINAFYFILFFIFYKSFYIFIGTRFDIWSLISLLFILMFFISWSKNYIENSKNKYETFIIIFVFYVIIISFINLFLSISKYVLSKLYTNLLIISLIIFSVNHYLLVL